MKQKQTTIYDQRIRGRFFSLPPLLSMQSTLPISIVPVSRPRMFVPKVSVPGFLQSLADHFVPHARNNYHPHMLGHRLTGLFSVMLVALKIFTLAAVSWGPVVPAYSSAITAGNIINLTNQSRQSYGLAELSENQTLNRAAQAKADDMLAKGYFSHNTPDGRTPWDFVVGAGYNYITAGENLAVNFTEAENVEAAWMNSPGHKANIINKNFREIGIGISQGTYQGHEAVFVVQMFGTPAEQKIAIDEKPTQIQPSAVPVPTVPESGILAAVRGQMSEQLAVGMPEVTVEGSLLVMQATTSPSAVKVLASVGQRAVMMEPKGDNTWVGSLPLSEAARENASIVVKAYDLNGISVSSPAAEFAGSTPQNYGGTPAQSARMVTLAGIHFDPAALEERFYVFFIAAMLTALVVAIGVRRHIQSISMVANGSFVAVLAAFLWMAG